MSDHGLRGMLQLCREALARPAAERPAYLDDACAGDEQLRRAVDALLAEQSSAADFLEAPTWTPDRPRLPASTRLDVAQDGQTFYAFKAAAPQPEPIVTHINLIENWFEELKARVPVR